VYNDVEPHHLGGGVVLFENAVSFDEEWVVGFSERQVSSERDAMYASAIDPETGKTGYLNKSGYFFDADAVNNMPRRGSAIHHNTDSNVIDFLNLIEQHKDAYLLKYLFMFPLAYKNIWWKVKGHLVAYSTEFGGKLLGLHSDTSADYAYGFTQPSDQLATRNTISCIVYFNDNFDGGHHYFNYLDIDYTPNKGDIMMFPSNFMASHEVKEITRGNRYTYLGWYAQGTPNAAVNEDVTDPITEPEFVKVATNVYMPNLRENFKLYLEQHDPSGSHPGHTLVSRMHS